MSNGSLRDSAFRNTNDPGSVLGHLIAYVKTVRSITNQIPTREEQEKLIRDAGLKGPINRELIGEGFTVLTVQR